MITRLTKDRILSINRNFMEQGWESREKVLNNYFYEQQVGKRIVLVY